MAEVTNGHPLPPADLQPLIEVELIDREHDEDRGEHAEIQELADEGIPIVVLDGVEEPGVPLVEQHVDGDEAEFDGDHAAEQDAARPAVLGAEVREGEAPDGAERGEKASHGVLLSCRPGLPGPFNTNFAGGTATSRPSDAAGGIRDPERPATTEARKSRPESPAVTVLVARMERPQSACEIRARPFPDYVVLRATPSGLQGNWSFRSAQRKGAASPRPRIAILLSGLQ